jgi:hypothetical protein
MMCMQMHMCSPLCSTQSPHLHAVCVAIQAEDPVLPFVIVDDRAAGAVDCLAAVALLHLQL